MEIKSDACVKQCPTSPGELVENTFKGSSSSKIFPWLQSGIFLVGLAMGALITASVCIYFGTSFEGLSKVEEVSEEEKCRDEGGRYEETSQNCILETSDNGGPCKANTDCEGWCLAGENDEIGVVEEGVCSDDYHPRGCFKFIDNGEVNSICMP